jgi:hypothetical protein
VVEVDEAAITIMIILGLWHFFLQIAEKQTDLKHKK